MKNSETLISKLKSQNLKPTPKWYFTIKGLTIGIIFFLLIMLGGLAFSVILFTIQQLDFDLITHMSHSSIEFLLGFLPFLWIVLLIVFLILGLFTFKKYRRGYKFSPARLFGVNTALSILIGTLFFMSGGGQWLENTFAVNIEIYESVNEKKINVWSNPENGYLSGHILRVDEESLRLQDFKNKQWTVNYSNATISYSVVFEEGEIIKIRGEMSSPEHFIADEIRPWGGNNRFNRKRNRQSE